LRALLWLRTRELLGETRDTSRLFILGILLCCWVTVCFIGSVEAVRHGSVQPFYVRYLAAGAWPLWAVVPLLGGGAGEVVASSRLAAFPVGARAVFGAAWVTALFDVPYLVVAPMLVALNAAAFGFAGLAASACFVVGASGLGQLAAWVSALALSGRRRSGLTALLLTGGVVGLLALAPRLLPGALSISQILPSGWVVSAESAATGGHAFSFALICLALAAPAALAALAGPLLARRTLAREARAGGVGARPWGGIGWWSRASVLRVLTVTATWSMVRAVGAQVALAGVLAVPAITHLPGLDFAQVSLAAMGTVAAVAAAVVLGINAFAFDAGGAALLFALPVSPEMVLAARALAVGGCLLVAQVAVTYVGAYSLHASAGTFAVSLGLDVCRTLSLAGLGLAWSLALPAASDYDSLRARVAPPRSILSFGAAAAVVSYASTQIVHDLGPVAGLATVGFASLVVGGLALRQARYLLRTGAGERVVAAVAA
jgi:hypothetical protein